MLQTYRKLQLKKAEAQGDESGFTLIELLIVIVVLGILAAIVVFALGGVTGKSVVSACQSDSKTVDVAVATYQAQNPGVNQVTQADLTGTNGTLQSWPSSTDYSISIAGDAYAIWKNPPTDTVHNTTTGDAVNPVANDVIVTVTNGNANNGNTYDATVNPSTACNGLS